MSASALDLRLGPYQVALADVTSVDCLIVDCPFSERTHVAYRDQEELRRRPISYDHFTESDVVEFVGSWSPRVKGWFVTITDHTLGAIWERELEHTGRYVFSPIALVEPGCTVRQSGDGPAQWAQRAIVACTENDLPEDERVVAWMLAARPRCAPFSKWGALPGAYVVPPGQGRQRNADNHHIGGKNLWTMRSLVRDYSRPGDTVVDPCMGGGTTLRAALLENRRAIGAEVDPVTYELAKRLCAEYPVDPTGQQQGLFG